MARLGTASRVLAVLAWGATLTSTAAVGASAAGAEPGGAVWGAGEGLSEDLRAALERDPGAPILGDSEGEVTVVEFLDYNCDPCRAVQDAVEQLLAEDPDVRLVIRAWPTEGPDSEAAARAAIAARAQGTAAFRVLHEALLRLDVPAGERPALVLAQVLGLDDALLRRDMDAPAIRDHLATSRSLAVALDLVEPPAFVVGDRLLVGAVSAEELREAVAATRQAAAE